MNTHQYIYCVILLLWMTPPLQLAAQRLQHPSDSSSAKVSQLSPVLLLDGEMLGEYRRKAIEHSPDLRAAQRNMEAALEMVGVSRADLKPKLAAGASYKYVGNPMELTVDLPALGDPFTIRGNNQQQYGATATISQPIYMGGRLLEMVKLSEHQADIAAHRTDLIYAVLCQQVEILYWNTVASAERVAIACESREAVDSLTSIIRCRVEAGVTDPNDLIMAEVKRNDADFQLIAARSHFENSGMALNTVAGISLDEPQRLDATVALLSTTSVATITTSKIMTPEEAIASKGIAMAKSRLRMTDSNYLPQLSIGAEGSFSSPGYNFRPDIDPNYAVYAKLSVPIFEWGKRTKEKRASNSRIKMAEEQLRATEDRASLDIATARRSFAYAQDQVSLSESSLDRAIENERRTTERYVEGRLSVTEVLQAQLFRQAARLNYMNARLAARNSWSDLKRALNLYNSQ